MSFLAVVPSVHEPWTKACVESMRAFPAGTVMVVDNSIRNRGVAASWNLGAREVLDRRLDWLVLVSAAVRFEEPWGAELIGALAAHTGALAVEGAWGLGWHLIAFNRSVFEAVGLFDENFWPAYGEDLDFSRRLMLAGLTAHTDRDFWPKVTVEAYVRGFAHGQRFGGAQHRGSGEDMLSYYERKWGGRPGGETYDRPFGCKPLDWWPPEGDPWATPRR